MKRRYILLLSTLVLFTNTVIITGCPTHVQPESATFKKPGNSSEVQNYHVALSSGSNGTLIADTPLPADGMVAAGSILTFTATPDSAYEVEAWTGAVANPSDSTKATLTVTAHTTVSVTFKEKQADVALLEISSSGRLTAVRNKYALRGNLIIPNTLRFFKTAQN